jgi:hypothetical protein
MWLVPLSMGLEAVRRAYSTARELARKVEGRLELIQPKHVYVRDAEKFGYTLQIGRITVNLPPAGIMVLWGFYNADEYLDFVRFVNNGRVHEWFVHPIAYYPERVGVWFEEPLILRGVVHVDVHATSTEGRDRVYGWPLGYVISPARPPQEVTVPRRAPRRKRAEERAEAGVSQKAEEAKEAGRGGEGGG